MSYLERFVLTSCLLIAACPTFAQEVDSLENDKIRLKEFVENGHLENTRLVNPEIEDVIQIAKRAEKKIFTPQNNELRKMARDFDEKYKRLLSNDMGRWVGQRPKLVASFIKIDSDQIELSDNALNERRMRLASCVQSLEGYTELTQGPFKANENKWAQTIVTDANWVEERFKLLKERLAVLANIESDFPADQDWSTYPTLREAKNKRIADVFAQIHAAEQEALDNAAKINAADIAQSVLDREVQKNQVRITGDAMLAEVEKRLMQAEFGKREKLIEKKIEEEKIAKQDIADNIVEIVETSKEQRLVDYLTSPRVSNLLAPFSCKGFCEPVAGVGFRRNDSLTRVPMSLSKISIQNTLSPNQQCMKRLIAIAVNPDNDRPSWPINHANYADDEDDFKDMNNQKVNRYVEAQRILREHGSKLVELGVLRN